MEYQNLNHQGLLGSIGYGRFWQSGENGFIELDRQDEAPFAGFADYLTDGSEQLLLSLALNQAAGGGGQGNSESGWGLGSPDLHGYQIDFARLVVHNLTITPYTDPIYGQGLIWDGHITWEFWGAPVPEPSTIAVLALGGFFVRSRSRRRA